MRWARVRAIDANIEIPPSRTSDNLKVSRAPKVVQEDTLIGSKPSNYALGRKIYNFNCYFCHGYSGNALTTARLYLDPPPRAFTDISPNHFLKKAMIEVVQEGRVDTAMKSFKKKLSSNEITAVVDFIHFEFVANKRVNTLYHTADNGWQNHERYKDAYPFVLGYLTLDMAWNELTYENKKGRTLYLSACVTCHDQSTENSVNGSTNIIWTKRPLSYPRNNYSHKHEHKISKNILDNIDTITSATPYSIHDRHPEIKNLTIEQKKGKQLYMDNCAFCHAKDGTGKNWIGRFLQPPAGDLTQLSDSMINLNQLRNRIRMGIEGSSMPAWRWVLEDEKIDLIISYINRAFMQGG